MGYDYVSFSVSLGMNTPCDSTSIPDYAVLNYNRNSPLGCFYPNTTYFYSPNQGCFRLSCLSIDAKVDVILNDLFPGTYVKIVNTADKKCQSEPISVLASRADSRCALAGYQISNTIQFNQDFKTNYSMWDNSRCVGTPVGRLTNSVMYSPTLGCVESLNGSVQYFAGNYPQKVTSAAKKSPLVSLLLYFLLVDLLN